MTFQNFNTKKIVIIAIALIVLITVVYFFLTSSKTNTSNTSTGVDISCKKDSDCVVKSMQSCCGKYPLCVNEDYQPSEEKNCPEGVAGICGFAPVSSCRCVNNRCKGY